MVPTRLTCDVDYCVVHTDSGPRPSIARYGIYHLFYTKEANKLRELQSYQSYNYKEKESDRLPKLHYSFEFICPVVTRGKI